MTRTIALVRTLDVETLTRSAIVIGFALVLRLAA